jgi:hypothetical protein
MKRRTIFGLMTAGALGLVAAGGAVAYPVFRSSGRACGSLGPVALQRRAAGLDPEEGQIEGSGQLHPLKRGRRLLQEDREPERGGHGVTTQPPAIPSVVPSAAVRPRVQTCRATRAMSGPGVMVRIAASPRKASRWTSGMG